MGGSGCGNSSEERQKPHWLGRNLAIVKTRYSPFRSSIGPLYGRQASLLPREGISRALEIGCGHEPIINNLPAGVEKFGIDISDVNPSGIKFKRRNLEHGLPFGSASFDIVVASGVIEYVYDTDRMLGECCRVLRRDGTLLLSTSNICSLRNIKHIIFGEQPKYADYDARGGGQIRHYGPNSLFKQLSECGFYVEKFTGSVVWLPFHAQIKPIERLGEKLAPLLPHYANALIVRARKARRLFSSQGLRA